MWFSHDVVMVFPFWPLFFLPRSLGCCVLLFSFGLHKVVPSFWGVPKFLLRFRVGLSFSSTTPLSFGKVKSGVPGRARGFVVFRHT